MIAGWNNNQQLHLLKLVLDKTSLKVFCMLPDCDCRRYEKVTEALCIRFNIEELH